MRDHMRTLSEIADSAISCYPNAGLPDENGHYHESPESLAKKMSAFAEQGWLNIAGGCCGTTPEHIRVMAETMAAYAPRTKMGEHPECSIRYRDRIYRAGKSSDHDRGTYEYFRIP